MQSPNDQDDPDMDESATPVITLASLMALAQAEQDFELYEFYHELTETVNQLSAVAAIVSRMYHSGAFTDEQWLILFRALDDAGLIA